MGTTLFLELDEKFQQTDLALDELLKMKLPKEAADALDMVIDNLKGALTLVTMINEKSQKDDHRISMLVKALRDAQIQLKDLDIELEG